MHRLLRVVLSVLNFVYFVQARILSLIHPKKPPGIPPITDSIYTLSAASLARKIREKEITSYEVVAAYIERIKVVNPIINAVIDARFEDAVIEAKIRDEQLRSGKLDVETLEKEKPLFGLPCTVKEGCFLKAREGVKVIEDVVEELRNAGAIPLCITNLPEMCADIDCANLPFERTCNPYDTRYTAGESFGGEAALLGAGASLIGIVSGMAGSVRVPAHFNGVFGHKPTPGIISNEGHSTTTENEIVEMYLVLGPLVRYAEDLGLVMKVLASKCDRNLRLNAPVDLKRLKIYYLQSLEETFGMLSIEPEIEQCVLRAVDHLSRYGSPTEKLPIEWPKAMLEITLAYYLSIKNTPAFLTPVDVDDQESSRKDPCIEMARAALGLSRQTTVPILLRTMTDKRCFSETQMSRYVQQGRRLRQNLLNLLGENEVFIYPTLRGAATFPQSAISETWNSLAYGAIATIFGLPATHVPMGLNRDGLSVGIQVIAAPYQDRLCLQVASSLERIFGGWVQPSISARNRVTQDDIFSIFG